MAARKNNLPAESAMQKAKGALPKEESLRSPEMGAEKQGFLGGADQLLHDILDAASAIIYVKDLEGCYLFINRQFERVFRRSMAELRGKDDIFLFGPELGATLRKNDGIVLARSEPLEVEEVVMHPDGLHTYISTKFPLFDNAGEAYAICGISTDISDRKHAESQLRESEARYRLLAENSFDLISRHAPDATYLYLSPVCESFLGFQPEELIGTNPFDLIHPDDREPVRKLQQAMREQRATKSAITCRLRRKDGSYIWSESV